MKLLAAGDLHWTARRRYDECKKVHWFMVDVARDEGVDVFVCPGDVYDGASTPEEREAVAAWLTAMAEVCPVLVIKGNHDRPTDLALMRRLSTKHPIVVEEAAAVHVIAGAAIACMAWPERSNLLAAAQAPSSELVDLTAQVLLRNVLLGLGNQLAAHDGPRILAGHFMVDGSVTSVGQPLIGQSMNVALSDLALAGADMVLMSHIHAPQEWRYGTMQALYTGSPYRTAYGEVEAKSVTLVEYEGAELVGWRRIETPCAPMFLLEDEWGIDDETGQPGWLCGWNGAPASSGYKGAEIRLRYQVDADRRAEALASAEAFKARLVELGAVDVKVDPEVKPVGMARAPEVAAAATIPDKLRALWKTRGTTPDARRSERLVNKVQELEAARAV